MSANNEENEYSPEWDSSSTYTQIRKRRNTVIAAFYKWEQTGVGNVEVGNLLLNTFTKKWQLLERDAFDPTHYFGTLAKKHQGNFLRAVIKVRPSQSRLVPSLWFSSYAKRKHNTRIKTHFSPTQNFPEIYSISGNEEDQQLAITQNSQFATRILQASREQVHEDCLLTLGKTLLAYDLYNQVLEEVADELAQRYEKPENSAASLGLNALHLDTITEEPEVQQEERESEEESDAEIEFEQDPEADTDFAEGNLKTNTGELLNHEESGDFDFETVHEAYKYIETSKAETETLSDEEEEDLANQDFLASVKIHRMTYKKIGEFTTREIEQTRKQIRAHLLRNNLNIAVLSVEGKKYRNQVAPFIHVKVASETEAAALVTLAALDIDDVGYIITPKSHRFTSFNVTFKANKANCQPTLSNIIEYLKTTVFGKYVNDIPFHQTYTEKEKLTHRFFATLKKPLGRFPEPATIESRNSKHALYTMPLEYPFKKIGVIWITRNCPAKYRKAAMAKRSYTAAVDKFKTPTAKTSTAATPAESTSGISAPRKTHSGYRYGNHPPDCTCSACRITATAEPLALANKFEQLPPEPDEDMDQN
ncbi:hypothetical protein CYMTET_15487 [Cymbomonas tetramitiformis]|uniref:Uncharacterized protein n=1 Tax=Cymbomonas tetramitiformis TaxID=36881 RepID=A0AAE0L8V4_9CHLO|nr:hypothetical protein CYMTET_15487 [Cymbomonas tetramitiformis]